MPKVFISHESKANSVDASFNYLESEDGKITARVVYPNFMPLEEAISITKGRGYRLIQAIYSGASNTYFVMFAPID